MDDWRMCEILRENGYTIENYEFEEPTVIPHYTLHETTWRTIKIPHLRLIAYKEKPKTALEASRCLLADVFDEFLINHFATLKNDENNALA